MAQGVQGVLADIEAVRSLFRRGKQRDFEEEMGDLSQLSLSEALAKVREASAAGLETPDILRDQIDFLQAGELNRQNQQAAIDQEAAVFRRGATERDRQVKQQRFDNVNTLRDDIKSATDDAAIQASVVRGMAVAPNNFAGDQLRINAFARTIQPTGILTEEDIKRVAGDPSVGAQIRRSLSKVLEGNILTPEDRSILLNAAVVQYKQNRRATNSIIGPVLKVAAMFQVSPDELIDPNIFIMDEELATFGVAPVTPINEVVTPAAPAQIEGQEVISMAEFMRRREAGGGR